MKKMPLIIAALLCASCTPAIVAVCLGVGASGFTAGVYYERAQEPADAGNDR